MTSARGTSSSDADGLVAVPPSGPLRDAALRLAPHPDQEQFSGRADQTLPLAERDPARHPYVLLEAGAPVAFFILDETPPDADPTADLYLRAFFVDAGAQGRGVATRAVAALPDVVRRDFPRVRSVVLTVDVRNLAARTVYVRGGFVDAGELYLGGSMGPQHVLRLELGAAGGRRSSGARTQASGSMLGSTSDVLSSSSGT